MHMRIFVFLLSKRFFVPKRVHEALSYARDINVFVNLSNIKGAGKKFYDIDENKKSCKWKGCDT